MQLKRIMARVTTVDLDVTSAAQGYRFWHFGCTILVLMLRQELYNTIRHACRTSNLVCISHDKTQRHPDRDELIFCTIYEIFLSNLRHLQD